jgi:tRNA-2-methylthio-N6-dimethylallyladenosine synthase
MFKEQVAEDVKMERLYRLIELQNDLSYAENQSLLGQSHEVLIEGRSKKFADRYSGRTRCHRLVHFPVEPGAELAGRLARVKLEKGFTWGFVGALEEVEPHRGAWSAVPQAG